AGDGDGRRQPRSDLGPVGSVRRRETVRDRQGGVARGHPRVPRRHLRGDRPAVTGTRQVPGDAVGSAGARAAAVDGAIAVPVSLSTSPPTFQRGTDMLETVRGPRQLIVGEGVAQNIPRVVAECGSRVLVVTDRVLL